MDLGAAENDEQREATYRFLNDEITTQHRMLLEETRGLDTKATLIAGFAATALSFLLANRRETVWWFALLAFLAAFTVALAALWPRRWDAILPQALHDELSDAAPVFVVGQVAGTKVEIYERTHRRARTKEIQWVISVALLAAGIGLSVWSTISEAAQ